MPGHICYMIPPYLLKAISQSPKDGDDDDDIQGSAIRALEFQNAYTAKRFDRFRALSTPRGAIRAGGQGASSHLCRRIIPDHMLKHISESADDYDTREGAKRDLEHMQVVRASRGDQASGQGLHYGAAKQRRLSDAPPSPEEKTEKTYRAIYDANHSFSQKLLPGQVVRVEGQKPDKQDKAVNEAYDNCGTVLKFYQDVFDWKSVDDHNMHVISSVHFGKKYENAFWDPDAQQMVYGDGNKFLSNFTGSVDVIGHEMTHAVTEYTSPLDYTGQAGALNEHVSDVFGIMIKQKVQNVKAVDDDWLIGEDCLMPGVKGVALRSMKAPGTAYDDPLFGKDPQPANFKQYEPTMEDNGGVHIYSGIPNRAFYLAAVGFEGYSWEKAGKIWWETMNSGEIPAKCKFQHFADVTVDKAEELFGDDAAKIVRKAWVKVGVQRKSHHDDNDDDGDDGDDGEL